MALRSDLCVCVCCVGGRAADQYDPKNEQHHKVGAGAVTLVVTGRRFSRVLGVSFNRDALLTPFDPL